MPFITHNKTPFETGAFIVPGRDGTKHVLTVVKGTWSFTKNGEVKLAGGQMPLCYGDEYWGEPGESSLRYASDLVLEKGGTDIALNGHAYPPNGTVATELTAELSVGPVKKRLRVTGERIWLWTTGIVSKTRPAPFTSMPLRYERAFGGRDTGHRNESRHRTCAENPVGTGYRTTRSKRSIDGHPLPNLEDESNRIKRWSDKPSPAGFGFIPPNWPPRSRYAGTCDVDWEMNRMPLLPTDNDVRFNNAAAPGLVADPCLNGRERVTLKNLHPSGGTVRFSLPGIRLRTAYIFEDRTFAPEPVLHTLLIEPDAERFTMVWASRYSKPYPISELLQVNVDYETKREKK